MSRAVQISLPSDETDRLVADIRRIDGVMSLSVQKNASVQPPGDVVTVVTSNRSLPQVMHVLNAHDVAHSADSSITTNELLSIVSPSASGVIPMDSNEATWEEIDTVLARESNMTINGMIVMAVAGIVAACGIATGALHVVIGAMVIAPGFEPITRVSLGLVARRRSTLPGLVYTARGYGMLVLGAVFATLILYAADMDPLGERETYHTSASLVSYWTSITLPSVLISAAASVAGAVLIAVNRSVLTAGVMIALALIPAMTLAAMALVVGDWELLGKGLLRWLIDVGLITVTSYLVFAWKRARVHRRKAMY